jgi:hypothetical protein
VDPDLKSSAPRAGLAGEEAEDPILPALVLLGVEARWVGTAPHDLLHDGVLRIDHGVLLFPDEVTTVSTVTKQVAACAELVPCTVGGDL